MGDTDTLPTLLAWCSANGIAIDPRLALVQDAATGDVAVYSRSDDYVDAPTTLVRIPKRAVLSARSCALAHDVPFAPYGHEAHLALALALYGELLLGAASRWAGYLQSLPPSGPDIALLWGSERDQTPQGRSQGRREDREDDRAGRGWAAGTELQHELGAGGGNRALDEARDYFASVARPILARHTLPPGASPSLPGFLHAYALVSSRAFLVDAYHGLAMVPIADAFNHAQDNHVHLESDIDVCVSCGAFAPCPHDEDEPGAPTQDAPAPQDEPDTETETCDMVSNRPLAPRAEAFNTYGAALTNAQLLARYGFVLEGNEQDAVVFAPEDAAAFAPARESRGSGSSSASAKDASGVGAGAGDAFVGTLHAALARWPRGTWGTSRLVYQPQPPPDATSDLQAGKTARGGQAGEDAGGGGATLPVRMCVNGDAQISHALWVCAALLALGAECAVDGERAGAALERLAARQLWWEAQDAGAGADDDEGADPDGDTHAADDGVAHAADDTHVADDTVLHALAGVVCWMCTQSPRARRLGRPPSGGEALGTDELGDLLDVSAVLVLFRFFAPCVGIGGAGAYVVIARVSPCSASPDPDSDWDCAGHQGAWEEVRLAWVSVYGTGAV